MHVCMYVTNNDVKTTTKYAVFAQSRGPVNHCQMYNGWPKYTTVSLSQTAARLVICEIPTVHTKVAHGIVHRA